jgi:hypothetical protein
MPTQSEENKQVIQQRYNALVRGDTDTLFASTHKGDPQERDRRVLRNMTFIASMGLAMILAAIFTTVLELTDFWRNLWLAICISFALLFLWGCFSWVRSLGVLENKVVKVCIFRNGSFLMDHTKINLLVCTT